MDNQHRAIKGYRELNQEEIALMNIVKEEGVRLSDLINKITACPSIDARWVAIAKTNLQQGLMALTRSIAKPDFF